MEQAGLKNAYVCERCGDRIVTILRDSGVTGFMICCRADGVGCGGMARSQMYRVDQSEEPTWEFYRPTDPKEISVLPQAAIDHVSNGGLLLRKIANEANSTREPKRGAIISVSMEELKKILRLPDSASIKGCWIPSPGGDVKVKIMDPLLPIVEEGQKYPELSHTFNDDGSISIHLG